MGVRKVLTVMAAASMVIAPTLAQAAPSAASRLSVRSVATAPARAGATTTRSNRDGGGSIIIAVLAAAAVIAGIVIAADNNNSPTSA
jgi:hypothetical protein